MTKDDLLAIIGARDETILQLETGLNNAINSIKAFLILAEPPDNMLVINPSEFPDINDFSLNTFRTPEGYLVHELVPPGGKAKPVSKIILPS